MSGLATLVTGGAGFIGSHLVDALLAAGRPVIVVDRGDRGFANLAAHRGDPRLSIVDADVADDALGDRLGPLLAGFEGVDAVVHLAAQVAVQRSIDDPIGDAEVNLVGSLRIVELARSLAARLVFASTAAVYGVSMALPVVEEDAGWPPSPYGIHKLAAEMHLRVAARVHALSAVTLRLFNVYGPRQDPRSPYAGVIARFVERALAGEALEIFGDGRQTRDFIHVHDVAQALLAACERGPRDGTPINVGGGQEIAVSELAERVIAACGSVSEVVMRPPRIGEVRRSRASIERMIVHLGVRPEIDLDHGLAEPAAWIAGGAEASDPGGLASR
ncbi:MAG: NAD-dependent epimerase/dehydratase family protein [Myxococcales bacterium]|nr:NAD-dependent epimerase/dehydratase family protein [Myxococcales bacterium]